MTASTSSGLRWVSIWRLSWPIILANMGVPLVGLVDTAVIGHSGSSQALGAIAFGALVFNLVYWCLGFLRMGTTGFTAQADGRGDEAEVRAVLGRALVLGIGIGLLLVVVQRPFADVTLRLLSGSPAVEALTRDYLLIRIWGAPASLGLYALMGLLVGLGRSDGLLRVQLVLNGLNIALDVLFAQGLGWGVGGVALGSALAEWLAFVYAVVVIARLMRARHLDAAFWPWRRILEARAIRDMLATNVDIMIRTVLLLAGFAWFVDRSARHGDVVLAANHILLQIVTLSAFFLDGYAHATETLVGRALGRGDLRLFERTLGMAMGLAGVTAAVLAALILSAGPLLIGLLTDIAAVAGLAGGHLGQVAVYVLLAFAAFELDGVFIGATRGRDLRNAAAVSLGVFLFAGHVLDRAYGNTGLWSAMIVYAVVRALTLAIRLPALRRHIVACPGADTGGGGPDRRSE